MPINKGWHKYFCLRKGRIYLKCQHGGGNLIAENLPTSDQRLERMRLAQEFEQHFPLLSPGGHCVCHCRDRVGGVALPSPTDPGVAPGAHFCHSKVALGSLQPPGWKCWTELWLWAPACRICRDALPGKLVSCQSENIPEEEVSIRNPIYSCTQKMLYGNNETVHGTSRFPHFIGPWCWFKPIRLGRLPLNTFLQSISKILFCCHRNENHDNPEANLYLHFSSCLPANAKRDCTHDAMQM